MIQYPNINPVILHVTDTLQIRWYGVMYLIGFAASWLALRLRTKHLPGWETTDRLNDLLFYTALGVILGGRIGYMLFYALPDWLSSPADIFKIWQGGMSFHGGLLGVIFSTWLFSRRYHEAFWTIGDIIAPAIPLGLLTGRIGNFINGELWGRTTDVPWAMIFPHAGPIPRHPSQLYAVLLEGVLLFIILWIYSAKPRKIGSVAGLFLLGYGCIRIFEEFFRQPDPQYGYLAFGWLTMGQLLCLPMILFGLYLMCCYSRKSKTSFQDSKAYK
jgi:phosphatidylglycerol:prolipoprotein diacylglycerol transferase